MPWSLSAQSLRRRGRRGVISGARPLKTGPGWGQAGVRSVRKGFCGQAALETVWAKLNGSVHSWAVLLPTLMSPAVAFRGIQPQHCQGTPPVLRAPLRGQKGPHPPEGSRPWDEGLIRLVPPPASQGALWPSCPGAFLRGVVSASPGSVSSSWPPPEASLSCLLCPLPAIPLSPHPPTLVRTLWLIIPGSPSPPCCSQPPIPSMFSLALFKSRKCSGLEIKEEETH